MEDVTYAKYMDHYISLKLIAGDILLSELSPSIYQAIINKYAKTHERETVKGFHYHLRAVLRDAMDEGLITRDVTRKAVLKGKLPTRRKKAKYLSRDELGRLIAVLDLLGDINLDYFIYLTAKTGIRFAEALGVTPESFDFANSRLNITQTLKYKGGAGRKDFARTKTESSNRIIQLDKETNDIFYRAVHGLPKRHSIFEAVFTADGHAINYYFNKRLEDRCDTAGVPVVSIHGLRHTHASLLLYADVSVQSISKRLGHSATRTTINTYLHLIDEMDDEDKNKIMNILSELDS